MSRVIIASGKVAKNPYRIAKIERNIYSIEELCYSLVQSAQFLDTEIMDPELVSWIGGELGLPDLAKKLSGYLGKERELTDFVTTILDYTGYVTQDRKIRTRQIVSSGNGMDSYERRLQRADYMAQNGQSYQAAAAYRQLLDDLPEPERSIRTKVLVRMGKIYAGLFRFRTASEYFRKAYDLAESKEIYLLYLTAVRFSLSDSEYVSFVAEHPESYEASLELEKRVKEANEAYGRSSDKALVEQMKEYREKGQETNYEIALHRVVTKMKDDYRKTRVSPL